MTENNGWNASMFKFNDTDINLKNKLIKLDYHEKNLIFGPEITKKILELVCPTKLELSECFLDHNDFNQLSNIEISFG